MWEHFPTHQVAVVQFVVCNNWKVIKKSFQSMLLIIDARKTTLTIPNASAFFLERLVHRSYSRSNFASQSEFNYPVGTECASVPMRLLGWIADTILDLPTIARKWTRSGSRSAVGSMVDVSVAALPSRPAPDVVYKRGHFLSALFHRGGQSIRIALVVVWTLSANINTK